MDAEKLALLEFCQTERQREAVQAWAKTGTYRPAAKLLGINERNTRKLLQRVRKLAERRGYAPQFDQVHPSPPTQIVKGVSTLYDADGNKSIQWVKTSADSQALVELMREVVDELKQDVKPRKPSKPPRHKTIAELLTAYILTDAHLGMLAWHEEGGADWDLTVAEQTIRDAFDYLIAHSPKAKTGFLMQLGDALHYDGLISITPSSGHVLDSDSRYHKIVRAAIRIFRDVIDHLLRKHERVIVLMSQGNHDPASSVWLQELFATLYSQDDRVEVIVSPLPYYAYQHEQILLGAHHGHKRTNLRDLCGTFADQFRDLLGDTQRTYIHSGHLHHDEAKSIGKTHVERHETLAARDAHTSHGGYNAGRSMKAITYGATAEHSRLSYHVEQ